MEQKRKIRYIIVFLLLGGCVVLLCVLNICIGSVSITVFDILASIQGKAVENARILWDIRMPRMLAALILGGALGLAGYLLQTFFHNPIAGPFVLGISSGAKMTVSVVMVFLMGQAISVSSGMMIVAAFVGAMISMGFVLLVSRKVDSMAMLVVAGVMIGYICSAITELVVTFADDAQIVNLHNWSRGSFSGTTWDNVTVMAVTVAVTSLAVFLLSKPLSAYQLGESYAKNLGVNVKGTSHGYGTSFKYSFCVYRGICRTDFFRRDCSAAFGKAVSFQYKADLNDSGMFLRRKCILLIL